MSLTGIWIRQFEMIH